MSSDLAKVNDPLVAPNGDILMPERDESYGYMNDSQEVEAQAPCEYKDYRPQVKRVTKDLRAPVDLVNAAAIVFSYTMLGISDTEICSNTGLRPEDLPRVRESTAYSEVFENIMRGLINANSEYIDARLAAHSGMALQNIAHIASTCPNTGHRLSASKDILDRSGHRPQDRHGGDVGMNELRIVIEDRKEEQDVNINLNFKGK